MDFLGMQGVPLEAFRSALKPISEAHNGQETPMFAKSIERQAMRQVEIDRRKHVTTQLGEGDHRACSDRSL